MDIACIEDQLMNVSVSDSNRLAFALIANYCLINESPNQSPNLLFSHHCLKLFQLKKALEEDGGKKCHFTFSRCEMTLGKFATIQAAAAVNKNGTIKLNCLATRTWIVGFAIHAADSQ